MLRKLLVVLTVLCALGSPCLAGSVPDMQEGLWEITSKTKMPGMEVPPVTHTQCLTKSDLVPGSSQPGQECEITHSEVVGNTVKWAIRCSSQGGEIKGTGTVTYRGNSFDGTMKMTMEGEKDMEFITHITGRRIGPCN